MKSQACAPCAKRKVRCDREEPCSNCKRRKNDQCIYPEMSPSERIKQLESMVKSLGGDPDENVVEKAEASPAAAKHLPIQHGKRKRRASNEHEHGQGTDSIIVQEDGESLYLDSVSWHSWNRAGIRPGENLHSSYAKDSPGIPVLARTSSVALQNILWCDASLDFSTKHPTPQEAIVLWTAFDKNVQPLHKIFFDWELDSMRTIATSYGSEKDFSSQEHALLFALYLVSVGSLSEADCVATFNEARSTKLSEFQMRCEQALARSNFLGASELLIVQAFTIYVTKIAGLDKISTRSLCSLMGVVIRSAERLGLHRDGTNFKLTPAETERRRRIWWQLQNLDMILAVKSGCVPITLGSDWDTKLPLNIEDNDVEPSSEKFPEERQALTAISFPLWIYYVLKEQREFHRVDGTRTGIFWTSDRLMSYEMKEALVTRLEAGLNNKFLQYCDPLKPIDCLVHLMGRAFICGMRRLMLHARVLNHKGSDGREKLEKELQGLCVRCLEYDIAMHSNPLIKHFEWRMGEWFPWTALAFVIFELWRQHNDSQVEELWTLLNNVYDAHSALSDFAEDRRKSYAAELIIAAWKARETFILEQSGNQPNGNLSLSIPSAVTKLEPLITTSGLHEAFPNIPSEKIAEAVWSSNIYELREVPSSIPNRQPPLATPNDLSQTDKLPMDYFDLGAMTGPMLSDIDWSFWDNMN